MDKVLFSEDHEWISFDGEIGTVGITDFAQEQLGEIVYVELPEAGNMVAKGDEVAVVESVKAANEIYAPVTGEIVAVNGKLSKDPELVNRDPRAEGWFFKLRLSDPGELDDLMEEDAYTEFAAEQS